MAEQVKAGPMTIEKQTVSKIRGLGAPEKQGPTIFLHLLTVRHH